MKRFFAYLGFYVACFVVCYVIGTGLGTVAWEISETFGWTP